MKGLIVIFGLLLHVSPLVWATEDLKSQSSKFEPTALNSKSQGNDPVADLPKLPQPAEWTWMDFGTHIGREVMEVVDLDGDGSKEMIITTNAPGDGAPNSVAVLETNLNIVKCAVDFRVKVHDIHYSQMDDDDQLELTMVSLHHLMIIDGKTCQTEFSHQFTEPKDAVGLGDLNADQVPDLVYSQYGNLYTAPVDDLSNTQVRQGFGGDSIIVESLGRAGGDDIGVYTQTHTVLRGDDLSTLQEIFNWQDDFFEFGDVDGDGSYEVVGLTESFPRVLTMVNVASGTVLYEHEVGNVTAIRAQDINQNGEYEILLGDDQNNNIVVMDHQGNAMFSMPNPRYDSANLIVADMNGNAQLEVYFSGGYGTTEADYLYRVDWATETVTWRSRDWDGPFQLSGGLYEDPQGRQSIGVAVAGSQSSYDEGGGFLINTSSGAPTPLFQPFNTTSNEVISTDIGKPNPNSNYLQCMAGDYFNRGIACFDLVTQQEVWHQDITDNDIFYLRLMDLDGDLNQELLTISRWGVIKAYDATTGTFLWKAADDLNGRINRGYKNVAWVNNQLWVLNEGHLHQINPTNGNTVTIINNSALTAIETINGILYGAISGVGMGEINPADQSMAQLIHPETQDITYMDVSQDGLVAFVSTGEIMNLGSTSEMDVTLVAIESQFEPWIIGEMRVYDTHFQDQFTLFISDQHSVRRYDLRVLVDLIFKGDFE